jgi:hypothetical protein
MQKTEVMSDLSRLKEPLERLIYFSGDAFTRTFIPVVCFDAEKTKSSLRESKRILLEEMII